MVVNFSAMLSILDYSVISLCYLSSIVHVGGAQNIVGIMEKSPRGP